MRTFVNYCFILLTFLPLLSIAQPVVNLGPDSSHCGSYLLDASNSGASFLWSTGEFSQTISVDTSGLYWVEVTDMTGTNRDTVVVDIYTLPVLINGPSDSTYCQGNVDLIALYSSGNVLWSNALGQLIETNDTFTHNLV
ncbi:hypothetical protein OAK19_06180, partial [Aureispira]|nr:hypothetical protein [Aureispira sp.]